MFKHFKPSEMTITSTGIPNDIHPDHLANVMVAAYGMECVRAILGDKSITVTSWYRNPKVNKAVGGVVNGDHPLGFAIDFRHSQLKAIEACRRIAASFLPFDQLILERNGTLVHISFNPRMRREILRQPGGPGSAFYQGLE